MKKLSLLILLLFFSCIRSICVIAKNEKLLKSSISNDNDKINLNNNKHKHFHIGCLNDCM